MASTITRPSGGPCFDAAREPGDFFLPWVMRGRVAVWPGGVKPPLRWPRVQGFDEELHGDGHGADRFLSSVRFTTMTENGFLVRARAAIVPLGFAAADARRELERPHPLTILRSPLRMRSW